MSRCIDADKIIAKYNKALSLAGNDGAIAALKFCKEIVQNAPSISPDEVHGVGKWIEDKEQNHVELTFHCSECGHKAVGRFEKTRYCGDCGAKMTETINALYEDVSEALALVRARETKINELVAQNKNLLAAVPKWISVEEQLPRTDDWVIVAILDERGDTPYQYTDFGWYLDAAKCWVVDAEQRRDITHWMPLPKAPKED